MSDLLRKEDSIVSEPGRNDRTPAESRSLVTPPPSDDLSAKEASHSTTATATVRAREDERVALFTTNEAADFRARWDSIQVGFVDEPRKAVEEADHLVSATMKRLSEIFSDERHNLERQWDRRDDISTEDFRLALRRYRSFFSRLLAM